MLTRGDYLIVEDTNLGGPLWGLERYLAAQKGRFELDKVREKFLMTHNPRGYWKCVA
jgi:cephalosporin hydroxylase